MKVRPAAVAGLFYPENSDDLTAELATFLLAAPPCVDLPKAFIVPHAKYANAGHISAAAYRCLQQSGSNIKNVILLGPAHNYALTGCALPSHDAFSTPLGQIPINQSLRENALKVNGVECDDIAHVMEHSLEVQLPFLQMCLTDFFILPVLVGKNANQSLLDLLSILPLSRDTLFIVSTDLSHYNGYSAALEIDEKTIKCILELDDNLSREHACGADTLNPFLQFCRFIGWQTKLLNSTNSGDVTGRKEEVVGYASFSVY